jgi:glycosyltransferase involved in cell wall biosynthesis
MACGTPVVTSNCTALPETAGGAAALVDDPTDVENIVAVVQQVLEDADYRESLRQRGLDRVQEYTWEACAMAHFELYLRVVEGRGGEH